MGTFGGCGREHDRGGVPVSGAIHSRDADVCRAREGRRTTARDPMALLGVYVPAYCSHGGVLMGHCCHVGSCDECEPGTGSGTTVVYNIVNHASRPAPAATSSPTTDHMRGLFES